MHVYSGNVYGLKNIGIYLNLIKDLQELQDGEVFSFHG